MQPFSAIQSFDYNGTTYLIEIVSGQKVVRVQALTDNHQPCGFEYAVTLSKDYYMDVLLESSAVKALIENAKRDVLENRWNNDQNELEKGEVAKWVHHSDERDPRTGFMVHTDTFDRPITEDRYREFLMRMNFHGYPLEGYGTGSVRQADKEGKVWVYRYSDSCD